MGRRGYELAIKLADKRVSAGRKVWIARDEPFEVVIWGVGYPEGIADDGPYAWCYNGESYYWFPMREVFSTRERAREGARS